jgi:hypothetical protein
LKHLTDDFVKTAAILAGKRLISTSSHDPLQCRETVCDKRWLQGGKLIKHASDGPKVTAEIIRPVVPNFRRPMNRKGLDLSKCDNELIEGSTYI